MQQGSVVAAGSNGENAKLKNKNKSNNNKNIYGKQACASNKNCQRMLHDRHSHTHVLHAIDWSKCMHMLLAVAPKCMHMPNQSSAKNSFGKRQISNLSELPCHIVCISGATNGHMYVLEYVAGSCNIRHIELHFLFVYRTQAIEY